MIVSLGFQGIYLTWASIKTPLTLLHPDSYLERRAGDEVVFRDAHTYIFISFSFHSYHDFVCEDKIIQFFYTRMYNIIFIPFPKLFPFINEHDVFPNAHY